MLALYKWPCVYLLGGIGMTGGNGLYHAVTEGNTKLIIFSGGFVDIFDQLYFHLGAMQSASVSLSGCHGGHAVGFGQSV